MTRKKRKTGMEEATAMVMGFANLVDALFQHYSGKTLTGWLAEPARRARELPPVGPSWPPEPKVRQPMPGDLEMPLTDAYAILGLKPDAPLAEVKKNYRNLAKCFHTDRGGMNDEAMKLINRAYERITKGER